MTTPETTETTPTTCTCGDSCGCGSSDTLAGADAGTQGDPAAGKCDCGC